MTERNLIEVSVGDIIEVPELGIQAVVNQVSPSLGASELLASEHGEVRLKAPGTITQPIRVIGKMLLHEVAEGTAACFSPRHTPDNADLVRRLSEILEEQVIQGPIQHPQA